MKQLAIIADDLSSATDCGIQMARTGLHTFVVLGDLSTIAEAGDVDIISLDTDSRSVLPNTAYERVKQVTKKLLSEGYARFYKSIDSTLRGNLGAEVDAILNNARFDGAVIAPAFPHYGRTTHEGKHYLNGIPITRTEFARDPQSPVQDDNLVNLIASQSVRKAGLVDLETLHFGANAVEKQMKSLLEHGVELIVFDAVEETDLDRIVQTVSASGFQMLWVGSTGLARCIPATLTLPQVNIQPEPKTMNSKPSILVIGSVSEVTNNQVKVCINQKKVQPIPVDPFQIVSAKEDIITQINRLIGLARELLSNGQNVVLFLDSDRKDVPLVQELGKEKGLDNMSLAQYLVHTLAEVVLRIVQEDLVSSVVLSGGDTAKAVTERLGANGIEILEEVEPGIPLCRLRGPYPILIVTKAGAFGTPEVLIDSLERVKRMA